MYIIIEKRLTSSERKRHWINIYKDYRKLFPNSHNTFNIRVNNEVEETYIDNYNRIMLGSTIFYKYNFDEPDTTIIIGKDSYGYFIEGK